MSGHSKWSTIKRSKGVADVRRGQLFTKLSRDISIAVREGGGGDPDLNYRLRLAVDKVQSRQHAHGHYREGHQQGCRRWGLPGTA